MKLNYVSHREELLEMGFVYDALAVKWQEIKTAPLTHKHLYGDLLVPANFQVPYGDIFWPKNTWGMNLGRVLGHI